MERGQVRVALRDAELAILNAPFEDDGWNRAAAAIACATKSSGVHLLALGGPLLLPLNVVHGGYAGYESYFADPVLHGQGNWRVCTTTVPMAIQHEAHYAAYRAAHDTSIYDDAVSDLDIPFGCQSALMVDRNGMMGVALLRARRDGICTHQTLSDFALLRAQLSRAVRMQIALDGEAAELMVGGVDAVSGSTILLDRHGNLCALTPAAEPLLNDDGPIAMEGLAIRLRDRGEDRFFQQALARLLASDGIRDVVVHQARIGRERCHARQGWKLVAVRLPRRDHGLGFDPHLAVTIQPIIASAA